MSGERANLAFEAEGRVARLRLAAPKANILDRAMIADLNRACDALVGRKNLVAIVLEAEGPNFSYGASVEEHLPGEIDKVLSELHALLGRLLELPAPTIAAIRGSCLGGGLELVLACDLLLAEEGARLGQPEIKLAVFPPAASALLPARIGAGPAAELILTGSTWSGTKAAELGLVARTTADGTLDEALAAWLADEFLDRSPAALAQAVRATRRTLRRAVEEDLPQLERQYIDELMVEPDAVEGIRAFLEKRPPRWESGT
ncbi:MAG: enoyl-CoA hydratase/isomerase family protein [Thermoanaerobaculia bacterium]